MKKITDFIIDKRYFILSLFIIFTITCAFISKNVKINYDMVKYLPDSSEVRVGNNIMEQEFSKVDVSTLNVMFENLKDNSKLEIKDELSKISGVKEVKYESNEEYNQGKYTLYVITIDAGKDSYLTSRVYNTVQDKYKDYTFYTSGDATESNKTVLSFWIVALAVFCALIILLIMCESFVEPFLFLTTILMAVVLNKGTNIIFPNVSHITNSITAILQMALSMDYSIMLMNRYDQEKKKEKNKVKAMKSALHKAFLSISSSSVTTIVGLLALVFMSFKIGKDLGFILAKGVLFSLLCIFFVLPSLILIFDKWINKTKKKSPHINLNKFGGLSYKTRFIAIPLFLIIFVTSFLLKGNLKIEYTASEGDFISKVFEENNQMAIIYKNKDESKITNYLDKLESNEKIDEVLGYSNTINQNLTYDKLNQKLDDLGSNTKLDDYLLKIIYYDYYNKKDNQITFKEFLNFIEMEAYNNPDVNKTIDSETKKDITRLKNFVMEPSINQRRGVNEIASILEIEESKVKDLFIYYLSLNTNQELTLNEFITFMNKNVLTNSKYASRINTNSREKLNTLAKFIDKNTIKKAMTVDEISNLFGIDKGVVSELYKYYILKSDITYKMSIKEFTNFVLNTVVKDSNYINMFDDETINNLRILETFSNQDIINQKMDSSMLSKLFGLDNDSVKEILLSKYLLKDNSNKFKIIDFINYVTKIKTDTHYLDNIDISNFKQLNNNILTDTKEYSKEEMALVIKLNVLDINKIYNLIDYLNGNNNLVETPLEFVNLILESEEIKNKLDDDTLSNLKLLQTVMISTSNDTKYAYYDLSFLGIDNTDNTTAKNIYTLYIYNSNTFKITPLEFTSFILNNKNDSMLSDKIESSKLNDLTLLERVMNETLINKKYNSINLADLIGIDKDNLKLLYGLYNYNYVNKNYSISLKEFINFLLNKVVTNSEYKNNFTKDKIDKLNTVNGIMNDSLKGVKYTKDEMFVIVNKLSNKVLKKTIEMLYIYYGSNKEYDNNWQITVEEFVNYLNNNILKDVRFDDYIDNDTKDKIVKAKDDIKDAKELLVGNNYSRIILNTKYDLEGVETFKFIEDTNNMLKKDIKDIYVIGDSEMAYEMSNTFDSELNLITIITMVAIFIVVLITFKSLIIPMVLVLIIQCAVFLTMGSLSLMGTDVYYISILIVQSILMGATIDYAILYTSYYLENRKMMNVKESLKASYNKSIHAILTSSSILIIVTLIIALFASEIAAKICRIISAGTLCSTILILLLLPSILASLDKFVIKKKDKKS